MLDAVRALAKAKPEDAVAKRKCAGCGRVLAVRDARQKYHSAKCRLKSFWRRNKRDYHAKDRVRPKRTRVHPERLCAYVTCGKEFVPVSRRNVYCEGCRKLPPVKRHTRR